MSLNDQAILDLQSIMENSNEFGTPVTFVKQNNIDYPVTVNCITNKIMLDEYDTLGNKIITERTTVAVHENSLIAAGYDIRDVNNNVAMIGDLVTMSVMGGVKNYAIKYQIPDQKLGCLVFVLEAYSAT